MKKFNCHFDVSEIALKPLNIDNLVNSLFDTERGNYSSKFTWLELGHSKNVFDMEQEKLGGGHLNHVWLPKVW